MHATHNNTQHALQTNMEVERLRLEKNTAEVRQKEEEERRKEVERRQKEEEARRKEAEQRQKEEQVHRREAEQRQKEVEKEHERALAEITALRAQVGMATLMCPSPISQ